MAQDEIVSIEPATGAELWRGKVGDVDEAVDRARRAWPAWAAQPLATRIELCRRFANEVRKESDKLANLIARETGKPLWEARTEVESVIAKVDISVTAYAERTGQKRLDSALQGTSAVRHKPHGVMVVLGPYNFPAHLPNGHIVPALIAGNVVIFKPSEKTPAVGELLMQCFNKAGIWPQSRSSCPAARPKGRHWLPIAASTESSSPARPRWGLQSTSVSRRTPARSSRWRWAATIRSS